MCVKCVWIISYLISALCFNLLLPVCRSSMFYNFVKAMLVRNPKKRPSASKMLSVRTAHKLLLSLKCVMMINVSELCFWFCCPQVARKSVIAGLTTFSLLVLWNLRLTVTTSRPVSLFILDRTNLDWLSLSLSLSPSFASCVSSLPLCSTCFWPSSAWTRSWPWTCWKSLETLRNWRAAWWRRTKRWRSVTIQPCGVKLCMLS